MNANLLRWAWLWREIEVRLPEGEFHLIYSGWGLGYETVYIDDAIAERGWGSFWFVPVFVFPIGDRLGIVEIRFWPWCTIRSFHLIIDGEVVYAEGQRGKVSYPPAWIADVHRRWEATGKVNKIITEKLSQLPIHEGIRGPGMVKRGEGESRE